MMPPNYSDFSANRRTGSGTYGRGTANKMWMSRKFFLLPGIFPLKIENHFQKILQKNYTKCVLNLLLALHPSARKVSVPDALSGPYQSGAGHGATAVGKCRTSA
jgi:hypothetical protein